MTGLLDDLLFSDALPSHPFAERHTRVVDRPIDAVWPACLEVTAKEVRTLGPLMALRHVPATLAGRRPPAAGAPEPLLDVFIDAGFVLLRRDDEPVDGRAVVIFGTASKFWAVAHNVPIPFGTPQAFLDFDEPDHAKTVVRLEAIDLGADTTRIETETWISGTDAGANRKFAPYWALIRLPSGLIRRSWLAAIDRRAQKS